VAAVDHLRSILAIVLDEKAARRASGEYAWPRLGAIADHALAALDEIERPEVDAATEASIAARVKALPDEAPPAGWEQRLEDRRAAEVAATHPWVPSGRLTDTELAQLYNTSKDETTVALAEELLVLRRRLAGIGGGS